MAWCHRSMVPTHVIFDVDDVILGCAMPEGETVKIKPGTAEVTGTLFVEEVKEDDVVVALYSMDVESVK